MGIALIKLKIMPRAMPENRIQISLNIEVSELESVESLSTYASAYPLIKRTTSTQLVLNNGQTLAISGLIKQKTEEQLQKFPWLADIPILGLFFRSRTTYTGGGRGELGDTELVVTVTPTILTTETSPVEKGTLINASKQMVKAQELPVGIGKPAIASYTRRVIRRIQDNFVYPPEAYEKKLQGLVSLSLHISSTGKLLEVKTNRSSGWSILDENAIKIIKHVSPFPPFPPDIEERELWINIPIAYNIK